MRSGDAIASLDPAIDSHALTRSGCPACPRGHRSDFEIGRSPAGPGRESPSPPERSATATSALAGRFAPWRWESAPPARSGRRRRACGAHRQLVWIRRGGSMRRPGGRSSTRSHLMTYDLAVGTEAAENRLERQIRTRPRRGTPRGALREHSSEPRRYRSALEGDQRRARGRRCRGFRARAVSRGGSRSRRQTGWRLRW